ncbi:MAG: FAD-binding oxidoreductase, partial [archaeon]|nr:FAD-binding oxidoreductase [archaeon]
MAIDQKVIEELEKVVGKDRISTSPAVLYTYGFDSSIYHHNPDVVVQPISTEEVSEIMKIAYKYEVPVTPRGAGTGLCGAAVPIMGGIVVAMQKMNKIKKISVNDNWV